MPPEANGLSLIMRMTRQAATVVEKINKLTAVVAWRLTCSIAIVSRINASRRMIAIHRGGEVAASLKRILLRRA